MWREEVEGEVVENREFMMSWKRRVNILVIGDSSSGKTSLIFAYKKKRFFEHLDPTTFEKVHVDAVFNDRHSLQPCSVKLEVRDVSGKDSHDRIRPLAYPLIDCIIITFSVGDEKSFERVKSKWYPEVYNNTNLRNKPIILVGTKIDLSSRRRKVDFKEGRMLSVEMAKKWDICSYFETSSKLLKGIDEIFDRAIYLTKLEWLSKIGILEVGDPYRLAKEFNHFEFNLMKMKIPNFNSLCWKYCNFDDAKTSSEYCMKSLTYLPLRSSNEKTKEMIMESDIIHCIFSVSEPNSLSRSIQELNRLRNLVRNHNRSQYHLSVESRRKISFKKIILVAKDIEYEWKVSFGQIEKCRLENGVNAVVYLSNLENFGQEVLKRTTVRIKKLFDEADQVNSDEMSQFTRRKDLLMLKNQDLSSQDMNNVERFIQRKGFVKNIHRYHLKKNKKVVSRYLRTSKRELVDMRQTLNDIKLEFIFNVRKMKKTLDSMNPSKIPYFRRKSRGRKRKRMKLLLRIRSMKSQIQNERKEWNEIRIQFREIWVMERKMRIIGFGIPLRSKIRETKKDLMKLKSDISSEMRRKIEIPFNRLRKAWAIATKVRQVRESLGGLRKLAVGMGKDLDRCFQRIRISLDATERKVTSLRTYNNCVHRTVVLDDDMLVSTKKIATKSLAAKKNDIQVNHQVKLEELRLACSSNFFVVIDSFKLLWKPFLDIGEYLGMINESLRMQGIKDEDIYLTDFSKSEGDVFRKFLSEFYHQEGASIMSKISSFHVNYEFLENHRPRHFGKSKTSFLYIGQTRFGSPSGKGVLFLPKSRSTYGLVYEGEFFKGSPNGRGREIDIRDGTIRYEGRYRLGLFHGRGIIYEKNGSVIEGEFKNGEVLNNEENQVYQFEVIHISKFSKFLNLSCQIGSGGNGQIYRVVHNRKKMAAKIIDLEQSVHKFYRPVLLEKIKDSIRICASLKHQNIVTTYGMIMGKNKIGFLMDLMDESLEKFIARKRGKISKKEKLRIIYEVAMGMEYLHHQKGLLHRDLKWSNILRKGKDIKIIDFDSIKNDDSSWRYNIQNTRTGIGTSFYLAPEISDRDYDNKVDVYSFGIMIYCMLFEITNPYALTVNCGCGMVTKNLTPVTLVNHVRDHGLRPTVEEFLEEKDEKMEKQIQKQKKKKKTKRKSKSKFDDYDVNSGKKSGNNSLLIPKELRFLVDLMQMCWDANPKRRPSFRRICDILDPKVKKSVEKKFFIIQASLRGKEDEGGSQGGQGRTVRVLVRDKRYKTIFSKIQKKFGCESSSKGDNVISDSRRKSQKKRKKKKRKITNRLLELHFVMEDGTIHKEFSDEEKNKVSEEEIRRVIGVFERKPVVDEPKQQNSSLIERKYYETKLRNERLEKRIQRMENEKHDFLKKLWLNMRLSDVEQSNEEENGEQEEEEERMVVNEDMVMKELIKRSIQMKETMKKKDKEIGQLKDQVKILEDINLGD